MRFNLLNGPALTAVLAATPLSASAQAVFEVGDAGDLPASAQVTNRYVTTIDGYLENHGIRGGYVGDTDMYRITISNPAAFSVMASSNMTGMPGVDDDTALYLLDGTGVLIAYNDDVAPGTFNPAFLAGDFAGLAVGDYYLAFNLLSDFPTFADGAFFPPVWPTSPVTGWTGTPQQERIGAYTLTLTGVGLREAEVDLPPGAVPEPTTWALMILGFGAAGAALRAQRRRSAFRPA